MAKKKKQHYVPRLLLKKFSEDKKSIRMFAFDSEKMIEQAPIKAQCYKDYLYGKDGVVEDALGGLEDKIATLLNHIINKDIEKLSNDDKMLILHFANFQEMRTEKAVNDLNSMNDKLVKAVLSHNPEFKNFNLNKIHIHFSNPIGFLLNQAWDALPLLLDLNIKFLENDTSIDFLISDHPLVLYNQWAEQHPLFKNYQSHFTGLALKGLIMFLPISPRHCLIIFDPITYKCCSKTGIYGKISSDKDVILLNKLQAINAQDSIYFMDEKKLNLSLYEYKIARNKNYARSQPIVNESLPTTSKEGRVGRLIVTNKGCIKINAIFSFLTIIDKNLYKGYRYASIPPRSWKAVKNFKKESRERGNFFKGEKDISTMSFKFSSKD